MVHKVPLSQIDGELGKRGTEGVGSYGPQPRRRPWEVPPNSLDPTLTLIIEILTGLGPDPQS